MSNLSVKQELSLLRSAVIGLIGRDPEGEYRPEFVDEMLRAVTEDRPTEAFTTPAAFLKRIRARNRRA